MSYANRQPFCLGLNELTLQSKESQYQHGMILTWQTQNFLVSAKMYQHIEAEQDGRHFGRQYFQVQFCWWKCFNFLKNFTRFFVPGCPIDNNSSLV